MRRQLPLLICLAVLTAVSEAWAQGQPKPLVTFQKVTEGVYVGRALDSPLIASAVMVIVNANDVMLVDTLCSPSETRKLLEEIKTITPKPVKYVVNTQYHYDHAHGNQAFGPDVQIIGSEYTRQVLLTDVMNQKTNRDFVASRRQQLEMLRKVPASETDAARRTREENIATIERFMSEQKDMRGTPPTTTFKSEMTVYAGDREIQLRFLGRGHTGGDIAVYLPKEKIIAVGYSLGGGFMGDAFVNDWPDTLENLSKIDFETMVPGHGWAIPGKEARAIIPGAQAYLRDLWKQAADLHAKGVSPAEAAKRIDVTTHKRPGPNEVAVQRMYDVMEGRIATY